MRPPVVFVWLTILFDPEAGWFGTSTKSICSPKLETPIAEDTIDEKAKAIASMKSTMTGTEAKAMNGARVWPKDFLEGWRLPRYDRLAGE